MFFLSIIDIYIYIMFYVIEIETIARTPEYAYINT